MKLISNLVFFGFALCILYYGRQVCATIGRLGQQSPAMDIPMWMVYAAAPTGFFLTCIRLIQRIRQQIIDWNKKPGVPQPCDDDGTPILL